LLYDGIAVTISSILTVDPPFIRYFRAVIVDPDIDMVKKGQHQGGCGGKKEGWNIKAQGPEEINPVGAIFKYSLSYKRLVPVGRIEMVGPGSTL